MSIKEQVENEVELVSTLAEKVKDKDEFKSMTVDEVRQLLSEGHRFIFTFIPKTQGRPETVFKVGAVKKTSFSEKEGAFCVFIFGMSGNSGPLVRYKGVRE